MFAVMNATNHIHGKECLSDQCRLNSAPTTMDAALQKIEDSINPVFSSMSFHVDKVSATFFNGSDGYDCDAPKYTFFTGPRNSRTKPYPRYVSAAYFQANGEVKKQWQTTTKQPSWDPEDRVIIFPFDPEKGTQAETALELKLRTFLVVHVQTGETKISLESVEGLASDTEIEIDGDKYKVLAVGVDFVLLKSALSKCYVAGTVVKAWAVPPELEKRIGAGEFEIEIFTDVRFGLAVHANRAMQFNYRLQFAYPDKSGAVAKYVNFPNATECLLPVYILREYQSMPKEAEKDYLMLSGNVGKLMLAFMLVELLAFCCLAGACWSFTGLFTFCAKPRTSDDPDRSTSSMWSSKRLRLVSKIRSTVSSKRSTGDAKTAQCGYSESDRKAAETTATTSSNAAAQSNQQESKVEAPTAIDSTTAMAAGAEDASQSHV
jgi:hypothetical protein